MAVSRELTIDNHVHRLVIVADLEGWDVREWEDATLVHRAHRADWHRVERDVLLFDVKTMTLKGGGWSEHCGSAERSCTSANGVLV